MKHIKIILVVLAFVSIGCAHKPLISPHADPDAVSSHQPIKTRQSKSRLYAENTKSVRQPIRTRQSRIKLYAENTDSLDDDFDTISGSDGDDFLEDDFGGGSDESGQKLDQMADPLYYWNKAMYHFNDKLYFWVLKPAAQGYKAITPEIVRTGIKNFFHNLGMPVRVVNCLLQGKGVSAGVELGRFVVNTTVGVLGFGDPARKLEMVPHEEDLGQTFGVYGIGEGCYIVLPFMGPSTLRDSLGMLGDTFLNPVHYVEPMEASIGVATFDKINATSFRIGDYEAMKEAAISPYEAFRNAYIQYRQKKIDE